MDKNNAKLLKTTTFSLVILKNIKISVSLLQQIHYLYDLFYREKLMDLGDFDEVDYYLIAIHTSLEDYRLAYFINQQLPINLSKVEMKFRFL
jgi:hypothetical protein